MFNKPTVFSDESGSHVLGKDGGIKASFTIADHGASHEGAAVSHLQQNFDDYMAESELGEAKDSREYGYEGEMTLNQLAQMEHHVGELKSMLKPNTDLPEWVQLKITLAADYIQTAADYMTGEMKEEAEIDEGVTNPEIKKAYADLLKTPGSSSERKAAVRRYKSLRQNAVKEEAEELEELSKGTLGSYIKKASGAEQPKNVMSPKNVPLTKIAAYQGDSETGHFGKRFNQGTYDKAERLRKNRSQGITRAADKLAKEEAVNPYAVGMAAAEKATGDKPPLEKSTIIKAHKIAKKVMKENKFLTGAIKKLEEGRGRPAKEGSAAWHRQQAATAAGKPKEEPVALGMQLRKAKSINAHVEFDDGKKHEIHPKHIEAFNDHMAHRRTTQEKGAFQKKASASHDAFVKAVSEPLPTKQDHGDRGFPKYR